MAANGVNAMQSDDHTAASYYFDSYAHFGIHEEMLKDQVRTRTYQNAILQNPDLFKGKIVLDVGCGTGILSLFAAKAGAKHVYGIEMSSIAEQATQIVLDNNYQQQVTIIRGKVEEVELPVDKVDIIVSEWMGYLLLYESMLDTVLYARDKWLNQGGLILPDKASLYLAAIEDGEYRNEKIDFWENVYGFDMRCIRKIAMTEPLVDNVDREQICTQTCRLITIDIMTVQKSDLAFTAPFELRATRNDYIHAIVAWFDVSFTQCHKPLSFTTSPEARNTHWKQTVFYLTDVLTINKGESVKGMIKCVPNAKNPRDLDIDLEYDFRGKKMSCHSSQQFKMR